MSNEMKRRPGRPRFVPTAEQRALVRRLAAIGTPHESICFVVRGAEGKRISVKTLTKYFRHELVVGRIEANAAMAAALFRAAMEGSLPAMIFWLKTRAGWSEQPDKVELTGADGKPLPMAPPALIVQFVDEDGEHCLPEHVSA
ncbi:MAG: hypothetical protein ACOZJZ_10710 [Pseudomonadota bacterium]